MAFGKVFYTLKEARVYQVKQKEKGENVDIRKMSKKIHPRRKKRYHVGYYMDYLNFA